MGKDINFQNSKFNALELNAIERLTIAGKRFADYEPSIDAIRLNWSGNFTGGLGIGAMRFSAGGAIGINTDNPLRAFHIVGSSSQMMIESTNNHKVGFWSDGNAQAFKLSLWSNTEASFNTALAVFQNTRNVSLGSDVDTGNKLYVLGNSRLDGNITMSGDFNFGGSSKYFGATGNLSIGATTDNGFKLRVNGDTQSNRFFSNSSFVGAVLLPVISSKYAKLQVSGQDDFENNPALIQLLQVNVGGGGIVSQRGASIDFVTTRASATQVNSNLFLKSEMNDSLGAINFHGDTGLSRRNSSSSIISRIATPSFSENDLGATLNIMNTRVGSNTREVYMSFSGDNNIYSEKRFCTKEFNIRNIQEIVSNSLGSAGDIKISADFIYVCTSPNTWKRTPLTTY